MVRESKENIMRVAKLLIHNFRSIKSAELLFGGHTLLVGRNNVGKSTICEALDLLLGPDRLRHTPAIDEYDFYNGKYLNADGTPIPILIEAVLVDLSTGAQNIFGRNLEFWNEQEHRLLDTGQIGETDSEHVHRCLRLQFKGQYDADEDEFVAKTYYAHSPDEEEEGELTEVYANQKREIGFLYLRALRTGSRALSLERGSLLDVLLRIGEIRPRLWEDTRKRLMELEPPIDDSIGTLRKVLDNIEARIRQYVPLDTSEKATRLFVSQLTREHLRKTLSFFMSTTPDQSPVPFQKLGTGTLNTLVFALLSAIAELKKDNVIFAMEEPEIAVPPHTQRRIVNYLVESTSQSFVTSHSPYVIERFGPDQIKILRRQDDGTVTGTPVTLSSGIKPKLFHRKLRHAIAETILGQAVIVGEGLVEFQVLQVASEIMESTDGNLWPFDLSGVSFFNSDGEGNLADYGAFFRSIGLKAFAFYDKRSRTAEETTKIESNFDSLKQTDYEGIEKLLVTEVPVSLQWQYLVDLGGHGLLPNGPSIPDAQPADSVVRQLMTQVLVDKKGDSRAVGLLRLCSVSQLPASIKTFLEGIYSQFTKPQAVTPLMVADGVIREDDNAQIPESPPS